METEFLKQLEEIIEEIKRKAIEFKRLSDFSVSKENYDKGALQLGIAMGLKEAERMISHFLQKAKSQRSKNKKNKKHDQRN
jgi:fructose-specific phosphotransferase system component IIB